MQQIFTNNKTTVVLLGIILFLGLFFKVLSTVKTKEEEVKINPIKLDTLRQNSTYPNYDKSLHTPDLSIDSVFTPPIEQNDINRDQVNALMNELISQKRPQEYANNRLTEPVSIAASSRMQVIDFEQPKEEKDREIKTKIVEIVAVIDKKTTLFNGGNVPIRFAEPLILEDGSIVNENTVFQSNCEIQGNRFNLKVNRLRNSEGRIIKIQVEEVIDFYDLRGGINRQRTKKQIRKEERNRQTQNIISSALANQASQAESQIASSFPTGGLISNLVRVSTQNTNYIAEATLPENYKIILYVKIPENHL